MRTNKMQVSYNYPVFKAGKVRVFSDFDRTFLPSSHKDFVKNNDAIFIKTITEYFKSFNEFLKNTRKGLKFTITTGRTFGEFLTMAEVARQREFRMPLPDTLIVKNGSDEHIRIGTDEDFYNGMEFPFKYEITNKEKEAKIKEVSGWDGAKFKKIIYDVLNQYKFRIVEADTEHSVNDYGSRSIFSEGKIPIETWKSSNDTVGIIRNGNLKTFLILPPDKDYIGEPRIIYQNMQIKFQEKANAEDIIYVHGDDTNIINGRPCLSYNPKITNNPIDCRLTKHYDSYEAYIEARKNNDLVIVAGDNSNDIGMLNPALYLERSLIDKLIKKYGADYFSNAISNAKNFIELLENDFELAEYFIKMPFRGIIVRQDNGENKLKELEPFTSGKFQKLIIVKEGELQNGIIKSIKAYCEQNPKYKEQLSTDLNKQIKQTTRKKAPDEDISDGDDGNNNGDNHNSSFLTYIISFLALLGIGTGTYLLYRKKKLEINNNTNIN
jgi:hypothetical protein